MEDRRRAGDPAESGREADGNVDIRTGRGPISARRRQAALKDVLSGVFMQTPPVPQTNNLLCSRPHCRLSIATSRYSMSRPLEEVRAETFSAQNAFGIMPSAAA